MSVNLMSAAKAGFSWTSNVPVRSCKFRSVTSSHPVLSGTVLVMLGPCGRSGKCSAAMQVLHVRRAGVALFLSPAVGAGVAVEEAAESVLSFSFLFLFFVFTLLESILDLLGRVGVGHSESKLDDIG